MARTVTVQFGGAERELVYTMRDAIEIKKLLGKRPRRVVDEDLIVALPGTTVADAGAVDAAALAVVLWCGISHEKDDPRKRIPEITQDVVVDWLTEHAPTEPLLELAAKVQDALYLSGILGLPLDLHEVMRQREAAAAEAAALAAQGTPPAVSDGTPGKALAPTPSTEIPTISTQS